MSSGEAFKRGFVGAAGAFAFALLLGLLLGLLFPPAPATPTLAAAGSGRCSRA